MTPARARELLNDAEPDAGGWGVLLCESPSALILVAPPTRLVLQRGAGITDAQARLMMAAPDLARALLAAVAERDALAGQVAAWVAAWRATGLVAFVPSEGGASENWDAIRAVLADTTDAAEEHDRRVRREALREAATLARGCHDYNGGHTAEPEHGIYHHGIDTVINVLDRAVGGEDDYQMRAVRREGERALAEEVER